MVFSFKILFIKRQHSAFNLNRNRKVQEIYYNLHKSYLNMKSILISAYKPHHVLFCIVVFEILFRGKLYILYLLEYNNINISAVEFT